MSSLISRPWVHFSSRIVATLTAALGIGSFSSIAFCAEGKDGPTYTSREAADGDYVFQGEYRGWQRPQPSYRSSVSVAMQVIARGDGQFDAVKYYGGLPGAGWKSPSKLTLTGVRSSDRVTLTGEQYDAEILGSTIKLFDKEGRHAGQLLRVERLSPTMGAEPPTGAIVLFDGGGDLSRWKNAKVSSDGLLAGTETVGQYGDFRLHGEFMLPYKPLARGQDRGNSGFYLQGRYEVQVLDSFGLEGIENECGSLYRTKRPDTNMCLPPLQWQSYDIDFTSAKFNAAGKKTSNMRITVWHNGVVIHDAASIPNKTGAGTVEGPTPLPIKLQEHGNPVVYRNIWLIDMSEPGASSIPWLKLPQVAPPVPL